MDDVESLIARLRLEPLPGEGGWFRQTWVGTNRRGDGRPEGSAIYYLLADESCSALHRLRGDEIWHFYAGNPVEMLLLGPADSGRVVLLGRDLAAGHEPQVVVPAGVWQGARSLAETGGLPVRPWSLLGCTLAPGWDERDFELGRRGELQRRFPDWSRQIARLTRG